MNPDQPTAGNKQLQFIPDELSDAARPYWAHVREKLIKAGIVNDLDREALIMLCEAWATLIDATDKLREHGLLVKGRHDYPVKNPALPIVNQAQAQVQRLLSELGMTPTSRQRLIAGPPKGGEEGDFDEF